MWKQIKHAPDNVPLRTKVDNDAGVRNDQCLTRVKNLWWFTDLTMYVYYTPTHFWMD